MAEACPIRQLTSSPFIVWSQLSRAVRLLQKSLEINAHSMDQLRRVLFKQVPTVRISNAYTQPEMATDLFEHDLGKLVVRC